MRGTEQGEQVKYYGQRIMRLAKWSTDIPRLDLVLDRISGYWVSSYGIGERVLLVLRKARDQVWPRSESYTCAASADQGRWIMTPLTGTPSVSMVVASRERVF